MYKAKPPNQDRPDSLVVLENSSYQHPSTTHPLAHHLLIRFHIYTNQNPELTALCPLFRLY